MKLARRTTRTCSVNSEYAWASDVKDPLNANALDQIT